MTDRYRDRCSDPSHRSVGRLLRDETGRTEELTHPERDVFQLSNARDEEAA